MNDCLSIISVVDRDSRFWKRNVELTRKLTPQGRLNHIGRGIYRVCRKASLATMACLLAWARLLITRPLRR
jgi:hypothetical protein